jgi:tRNA-dihydrouridine synthase
VEDKLNLLLYHAKLFREKYPQRNFDEIRKYFAGYVSDFPGAKELRIKLMEAKNGVGIKIIVDQYLKK